MVRAKGYTDAENREIAELWRANVPVKSIAERMNRTLTSLYNHARRIGLPSSKDRRKGATLPVVHPRPIERGECEFCPSCQAYRDHEADELECDHDPDTYHFHTRPCVFLGCRHHNGATLGEFQVPTHNRCNESCSLDVADRGENTLEDVGYALGVSGERVRQIQNAAEESFILSKKNLAIPLGGTGGDW